ncbi:cell division protein FtsZ [Vespertiliibacter pulmonis]|uniref:Cell division protein FtsZ n=1 Tax=Vespertiliibacter pulmonis TaxID=1443036 RepID=A0A3N4VTI3_9PAST|nr:cell division protein FtsZ [Vespertiliibacter pulmonis]QLB20418.1 cell division protein FtsZ [Vespertiliibacter pulmonis]RPE86406.1 cell division protein FtsZ [Vespertiliibacter pulmonis]
MFEPIYESTQDAVIKVIGVGGGGGNALNHMVSTQSEDAGSVEFFSVNTDAQVLRSSAVRNTIQIGATVTKGLGAGADPNVGHQAAEEDRDALTNMLAGADMVFIAVGMGGGTGTGAAPVIAEIAKNQGALTVGIVTKPFSFEGRKRSGYAEQGIKELAKHVDSLIIIQNDKLLKVLPKNVKFSEAFGVANDVLRNAVLGITDMITSEGLVNVDFADVKKVMSEMGRAMMGTGIAEGENRAENAAKEAVASPLLEDVDLSGAKGILVNISSGFDIELAEVNTIMEYVTSFADPDAVIILGSAFNAEMEGKIRVTLVATGIGQPEDITPPRVTGFQNQQGFVNAAPQPQQTAQTTQPNQPQFVNTMGGYQQPTQFAQQPAQFAQPQQTAAKPQQVDSSQVFSPTSIIPGFMRNGQ